MPLRQPKHARNKTLPKQQNAFLQTLQPKGRQTGVISASQPGLQFARSETSERDTDLDTRDKACCNASSSLRLA